MTAEIEQLPDESRASFMLRVAAAYIRNNCPKGSIYYDEILCDGYCVADDCEWAADEQC